MQNLSTERVYIPILILHFLYKNLWLKKPKVLFLETAGLIDLKDVIDQEIRYR